jgi:hypothetical protein
MLLYRSVRRAFVIVSSVPRVILSISNLSLLLVPTINFNLSTSLSLRSTKRLRSAQGLSLRPAQCLSLRPAQCLSLRSAHRLSRLRYIHRGKGGKKCKREPGCGWQNNQCVRDYCRDHESNKDSCLAASSICLQMERNYCITI